MLIIGATLALLAMLLLLMWTLRGRQVSSISEPHLHRVDTVAFRNLLSEAEDQYLRVSLSSAQYRTVRRARLRASQEYLLWIAEDCAVLLAAVRGNTVQASGEAAAIAQNAVRLRVITLAFWSLLWVEYLTPGLRVRPFRALRRYEEFWRSAEQYLRSQHSHAAISIR